MDIEFHDQLPAPAAVGGRKPKPEEVDFAEQLRRNPGRWAEHPCPPPASTSRQSLVTGINHGTRPAFAAGGYRAAIRQGVLYVSYEGEL